MDERACPPPLIVSHFPAPQRSMRVAVVTETYPPEVNGVSLTLARLVEGLHARNHDVQLVRPRQESRDAAGTGAPSFDEVLTRGLPIPRYPNLRMGLPSRRALVQLWSRRRPDVVHIATEGPLGWSALQAALQLKLPVSSDFRTNFHAYSQHYGLGWLHKPIMAYLRKFHQRAHCTLVPTEALQRELAEAGFRHLMVVGRGVDTRQFHPARRSEALRAHWGVGPDELVMCCVGRLAAEKNLGLLLNAWDAARQARPGVRLLLVGDGPLRADLQARHPQVLFAGQRRGEDLAAHYASADLFVFPSLTETFGNVIPEAMACGLPVLAFDCAAAGQLVVPGEHGALVAPGDSAGFIRQAGTLAARPEALRPMGLKARERAEQHGWDAVVQRFEGVLLQVMQQAHAPATLAWAPVAG